MQERFENRRWKGNFEQEGETSELAGKDRFREQEKVVLDLHGGSSKAGKSVGCGGPPRGVEFRCRDAVLFASATSYHACSCCLGRTRVLIQRRWLRFVVVSWYKHFHGQDWDAIGLSIRYWIKGSLGWLGPGRVSVSLCCVKRI